MCSMTTLSRTLYLMCSMTTSSSTSSFPSLMSSMSCKSKKPKKCAKKEKKEKKEKKKNWGWQLSSWQKFFLGGWKCPNLGVVNVRILGVVNVLLANDSQSCRFHWILDPKSDRPELLGSLFLKLRIDYMSPQKSILDFLISFEILGGIKVKRRVQW